MVKTKDYDVRSGIVRQLLSEGIERKNIRHEITLDTSSSGGRADLVILTDAAIIGIEIKSGSDTIDRCSAQFEAYRTSFDAIHLVIDADLSKKITEKLDWDDIIFHSEELRFSNKWNDKRALPGGLRFEISKINSSETSAISMARLLWRAETEFVTGSIGHRIKRRSDALKWIRENACLKELRPLVVKMLRQRIPNLWENSFWSKFDQKA